MWRKCLACCALSIGLAAPMFGQSAQQTPQIPGIPDASVGPGRTTQPADKTMDDMLRENARKLNKKRQEDLKRDTDKLVKLADELKQYVDKSNENVLSLEVLRKAEEIEKLARSVKEKMRGE